MKRSLLIFLALILAACGTTAAPTQQPVAAPPEPTQTAVVLVETVVVVATSEVPPATALPTYTPLPTYTLPPEPTQEAAHQPAPTEAVAAPTEAAPAASAGPIKVDDALGKGWFLEMTRDRNDFSLRCQLNKTITFNTKTTSADIRNVDLWYRIEDRDTGAIFDWVNFGKMVPNNEGGFTLSISGDQLNPNFRKPNAFFDYQFVGYNATGVVGRSEKIERQITYTFECP